LDLVGAHSSDEDVASWVERLWRSQDSYCWLLEREWQQHLLYHENIQYVTYHLPSRRWLQRSALPWRIRSVYNVVAKAVRLRVARLTENKPTVMVQAETLDRHDVELAELKEQLFWHTWQTLKLHDLVVRARRWATITGSGFLKVSWDPEAGATYPRTLKRPRYRTIAVPLAGPDGQARVGPDGRPAVEYREVYDGIEEVYVDAKGRVLGPVFEVEHDSARPGEPMKRRLEPPDDVDWVTEGDVAVDVRSPFNVRWDWYTREIADSWWVADSEIVSGVDVLAAWPEKAEELAEARPAGEEDELLDWQHWHAHGEVDWPGSVPARGEREDPLKRRYVVREVWVFPKNELVRRLWGRKGALLIVVGGKLIHRSELPPWALERCPFVQFFDLEEEGNHYGRSFLRDLIPIQDDINRARSTWAEQVALKSRLLLWAPEGSAMNLRLLGALPGALLETAGPEYTPKLLELGTGSEGTEGFYQASLSAAQDLGHTQDASVGRLPAAGLAAKAIYALQYADERSVQEVSNAQDVALAKLAEAIEAVQRHGYTVERKIRIVGPDRAYVVQREIAPADLDFSVDYQFVPGSMLSRSREAVRNELFTLREAGLIDDATIRRALPAAVPDAYRRSYDLHEARARRLLDRLRNEPDAQVAPEAYDDPAVHEAVFREFMLTRAFELESEEVRRRILQYWQLVVVTQQRRQQAQAQPQAQPQAAQATQGQQAVSAAAPAEPAPVGAEGQEPFPPPEQIQTMAEQAERAMRPPAGFERP
jgi:hypothetical protein